ncbi:MAG: MATE family efflux transporter, partial [Gemmiger sp.]
GNVVGAGYYILYFMSVKSAVSVSLRDCTIKNGVARKVLEIGIPASLGSLLMSFSQIVVNALMAGYGDMAVAGIGVAMKVTMMTGMVCIGFGQGIQPLLGYCVGAQLWERFRNVMRFSVIFAFVLSMVMTIVCYLFTGQIVGVFLTDASAYDFALRFARILLSTSFLFGIFYVLSNALQAMGAATAALIVNLSRQGLIYIPALFVLRVMFGADGLAWAQPVADILSTALVAVLYVRSYRHMAKTK